MTCGKDLVNGFSLSVKSKQLINAAEIAIRKQIRVASRNEEEVKKYEQMAQETGNLADVILSPQNFRNLLDFSNFGFTPQSGF